MSPESQALNSVGNINIFLMVLHKYSLFPFLPFQLWNLSRGVSHQQGGDLLSHYKISGIGFVQNLQKIDKDRYGLLKYMIIFLPNLSLLVSYLAGGLCSPLSISFTNITTSDVLMTSTSLC